MSARRGYGCFSDHGCHLLVPDGSIVVNPATLPWRLARSAPVARMLCVPSRRAADRRCRGARREARRRIRGRHGRSVLRSARRSDLRRAGRRRRHCGGRQRSHGPSPGSRGRARPGSTCSRRRSSKIAASTSSSTRPGVSRYDERLAAAARLGAVVTTPTALFMEDFRDRRVVAVTGSKGKTTTAMLTAAALGAYGLDVALAGNIGRPVTELYDDDAHDVFVVEISSFQAADVTVSPSVGVLTLLAPDHLDWHRNLENYYEDKLRLFSHRAGVPVAVNGCCDEAVARSSSVGRQGPLRRQRSGAPRRSQGRGVRSRALGPRRVSAAGGAQPRQRLRRVTAALLLTGELPDQGRLERELSR